MNDHSRVPRAQQRMKIGSLAMLRSRGVRFARASREKLTPLLRPYFRINSHSFRPILIATALVLAFFLTASRQPLRAQETLEIKIRPFREKNIDYRREYKFQLLELLLDKTADEGPYRITVLEQEQIAQSRVLDLIERGELTLIATMTSKEREEKLRPLRIPIYKNLYGYRIFIINKKDQEKFARITTVQQLQKLWAGLGHDWPDLKILKANGFNVVASSSYDGLFPMLKEGRFDYFPRGIQEPWREVEVHKESDLMVEPTLLLHYHAPIYLFVAKTNDALYDRLERGFQRAITDGSFDRFFNNHWYVRDTLQLAKINQRRIFTLKNPLLPDKTPLDRQEFWYTVDTATQP